jgi:hypothetical protein
MKEQDYINTLLCGVIIFRLGKEYIFAKPASAEDKTFADFLSYEFYQDCILEGLPTEEEVKEWHSVDEDFIKTISDNLENMKVDYFNNFFNSSIKEYISKNIENQNKRIEEHLEQNNIFYDKTCEYLQSYCKYVHLLEKTLFLQDGTSASKKYSLTLLAGKYNLAVNDIQKRIRDTAKSYQWRNMWFGQKEQIFLNHPSTFTDIQNSLISWSHYYDSINESLERPSENIIQDNIALDGWAIVQQRKRASEEKERQVDSMLSDKTKSAGELFLPARNKEEVKEILDLNNQQGKAKLKSLSNDLKTKGSVSASQLTSTRQEIQMQANKQSSERRRNRG